MEKNGKNSVLAVIVTHNRRKELGTCIEAVKRQTYQNVDLLVVNNGSTDGTAEFLSKCSGVISINQDNLGGAGGFYAGQKYAFDNGYDWVWMMDDDGMPEENQLEELIRFSDQSGRPFLNALVVNIDDRIRMSFGSFSYENNVKAVQKVEYIEGVHLFNGTLIHRSVLGKIGFVKKEMFIWGDELEYNERAKSFGYIPTTVTHAIHYHPGEKGIWANPIPFVNKYRILRKPKSLAKYYYRNEAYVIKTYCHPKTPWVCKYVIFNMIYDIRTFRFGELFRFIRYYYKGTKGIFE